MQNFCVQSWNIQGVINITGHTSFKKISRYLLNLSPDIVALQEMCDAEKLLKNTRGLKTYNVFIPKLNKDFHENHPGFNHNVLLSKYLIVAAGEITFPDWGQKTFLENATWADVEIGQKLLRIYNCHFGIMKIGIATRLKQLEYLLADCQNHNGRVIICGDMNVTIPPTGWNRKIISLWHQEPKREMSVNGKFIDYDEREIFNTTINQHGFKELLDLTTPTWSPIKSEIWEMFKLKLDWFMVKNLQVTDVKLGPYVSDHRPAEVQCQL